MAQGPKPIDLPQLSNTETQILDDLELRIDQCLDACDTGDKNLSIYLESCTVEQSHLTRAMVLYKIPRLSVPIIMHLTERYKKAGWAQVYYDLTYCGDCKAKEGKYKSHHFVHFVRPV